MPLCLQVLTEMSRPMIDSMISWYFGARRKAPNVIRTSANEPSQRASQWGVSTPNPYYLHTRSATSLLSSSGCVHLDSNTMVLLTPIQWPQTLTSGNDYGAPSHPHKSLPKSHAVGASPHRDDANHHSNLALTNSIECSTIIVMTSASTTTSTCTHWGSPNWPNADSLGLSSTSWNAN